MCCALVHCQKILKAATGMLPQFLDMHNSGCQAIQEGNAMLCMCIIIKFRGGQAVNDMLETV